MEIHIVFIVFLIFPLILCTRFLMNYWTDFIHYFPDYWIVVWSDLFLILWIFTTFVCLVDLRNYKENDNGKSYSLCCLMQTAPFSGACLGTTFWYDFLFKIFKRYCPYLFYQLIFYGDVHVLQKMVEYLKFFYRKGKGAFPLNMGQ